MRVPVIIFCTLLLAIASCRNNSKAPDAPTNDSAAYARSLKAEDSALLQSSSVAAWIAQRLQQKSFKWNKLRLDQYYKNDSLAADELFAEEEFYKNYRSVLRWSPDSSYILDIGSYGSVLVKDDKGNMQVEAGEPDSEVSLLQPSTNQKISLFFVGPSSNF